MKKYLITIFIGLVAIFICDFLIGTGLEYFYRKTKKSSHLGHITYTLEETNEDVLIFGTSRGHHHYDANMIADSLGLTTYNTGLDGHFIFYQTAALKSVLARYTPKKVVLDFSGTFEYDQSDYDRLATLLPYYDTHPELEDIILMRSYFERYKLISSIYPYNSLILTIMKGNVAKDSKKNLNGYSPINKVYKGTLDSIPVKEYYEVDPNKIESFKEFLKLSKDNDIDIVVVCSPNYYEFKKSYSLELCRDMCKEFEVPFLDYSKDEYYLKHVELFKDRTHMNKQGATRFTQEIIDLLKKS
ncbi:hypothetical protein NBRC110019_17540 [Neptunitalea chrysea]|uniref:SGNH/GDSL hydrolase family protein n=1 Tax=Neptunitalea chrysea TaxID=1647581 RepID=A0A9W6EUL1_9FLAO|nr:hypothetical protein [Neptunitalea chrysea]GLB52714.1 hypothetical protein NBRC110019_17540 [Neptunitalea chrysea]